MDETHHASHPDPVIALIAKKANLTICTDIDSSLDVVREVWRTNGADGRNTGAVRCVYTPLAEVDGLRAFFPDATSLMGLYRKSGKIAVEMARCMLGGARGKKMFGLYGLDDAHAAKESSVFTVKAALLTESLTNLLFS